MLTSIIFSFPYMTFKVNFGKGLFILSTFFALPIMQKLVFFFLWQFYASKKHSMHIWHYLLLHGRNFFNILESYALSAKDKYLTKINLVASNTFIIKLLINYTNCYPKIYYKDLSYFLFIPFPRMWTFNECRKGSIYRIS